MKRALTSLVAFVGLASLALVGCGPTCSSDEVSVRKTGGGSVCVLTERHAEGEGSPVGPTEPYEPYESVTIPPGTTVPPASVGPDSGSSSGCRAEDAGDLTVHVVAKGGTAPTITPTAPPDGRYVLVQATSFGGAAGAPSIAALRAEVAVQGAVWVIGARAVDGSSIGGPESITLSVVADTATDVCSVSPGSVASSLFPNTGATTRATVGWDGAASTLTMVLTTPKGADVELVFVLD